MKHLRIITREDGFSLPEIILTTSIFILLLGYGLVNVVQVTNKTSLRTNTDTFTTDIKQQQLKAITGNTVLGTNDSYGIHFQSNSYVLFHGTVFNANDTTNSTINLDTNSQFVNDTFPSQNLIFTKGSGEMVGFIQGSNTIGIKNIKTSDIKTITINKYGIITQIN